MGPLLVAGVALLPLSACVLSLRHEPMTRGLAPVSDATTGPSALDSFYSYPQADVRFRNAVLHKEESEHYRVRLIRFESLGDNGQPENLVRGRYYESKRPGQHPLAVILPIWGGHAYPSERTAKALRRRSQGRLNIFEMLGKDLLSDWEAMARARDREEFLDEWRRAVDRERTMVTDIRRTLDWAVVRPEVDADRMALVGFSHGAIVAAVTAQQERRLAAMVVVMGGARFHETAVRCPLKKSDGMRRRAAQLGWSLDELELELEPLLRPIDPASYSGQVDPERVLLVEATKDECMSEASRRHFYEVLGRPERIRIGAGHHRAFLAMTPLGFNRLRRHIWRFLDSKLAVSPGPSQSR